MVVAVVYGCMHSKYFNYDRAAVSQAGVACVPFIHGCSNALAVNYDAAARSPPPLFCI